MVFEMGSLQTDVKRVRLLREGFSREGSSMPAEAPKLVPNGHGAFSISQERGSPYQAPVPDEQHERVI